MVRLSLVVRLFFLTASFATTIPDPTTASTATAPTPIPTACGDIVNSCDKTPFSAARAYDCLISVPFVPAVATRFLKYYSDSIQFQSTLAYLKNPPTSYQQPAVDLLQGLERIQQDIDNGLFSTQYAFEVTLQNLIYSAHDTHVNLVSGILGAFTFLSPHGIVSASIDGVQIPKVYISDDLSGFDGSWQPSAISTINGQNVTDYLTQFAAVNAIGNLEPNADWNALMSSSAKDIQGGYGIFEGYVTFYPGDTINFVFENGTDTGPQSWLAVYNSPGDTGPLVTGGDFYNFFVLGHLPASYDPASPTNRDPAPTAEATSSVSSDASSTSVAAPAATSALTGWGDGFAYPPIADVVQSDLGNTGSVTGYFLHDILTAVLSIPTFQTFDQDSTQAFSAVIGQFLQSSKAAGMTKVIVDLQQNTGGDALLAPDTFRQFFPTIDPFGGSQLRAHTAADVLGNTFTNYYSPSLNETYHDLLSASDWVATDRINANTNQNFTSWGEFFGPHLDNGDNFTTTLTDGLCASTCALFMEMMHYEAGVQTVVVGGRPSTGPMQAPAGTRGAQVYTLGPLDGDLDADIAFAISINATIAASFPNTAEEIQINFASLNLRNQIRPNETTPLQFVYEAADCRIFYTLLNAYNYTKLWHDAANAIWTTPSLCVQGSTGYATNGTSSDTTGPPSGSIPSVAYNMSSILGLSGVTSNVASFSGVELDGTRIKATEAGTLCGGGNAAPVCIGGQTKCSSARISTCGKTSFVCVKECSSLNPHVCGTGGCRYYNGAGSPHTKLVEGGTNKVKYGYCPLKVKCGSTPDSVNPNGPPSPPESDDEVDRSVVRGKMSLGDLIRAGMEIGS